MKPQKRSNHLEILFEDKSLVIVVKPHGMLSTSFAGSRGKSAQDVLANHFRSRGKRTIYAVHRLDRDTSGVMMFALSEQLGKRIMDDWTNMVQERTYRCVCLREPGAAPLPESQTLKNEIAYNRYGIGFVPLGPPQKKDRTVTAISKIRVLTRGAHADLVECDLVTGRKNQIRIQMAHLGHPISGDPNYGNMRDSRNRLALHACVLAFTHPVTREALRFESREPKEFISLLGNRQGPNPSRGKRGF